ncbi:MAG TPA: hypothetical protein VG028_13325 [Terriglobia bacterium]|nr:hypothetical protein [Terriglobia bacterium]
MQAGAKKAKARSGARAVKRRERARKSKKGIFEALRWTLSLAASEFGINPRTVVKRVKAAGLVAGKDGKFSTAQIHAAICGDYERQRTRKTKEEADAKALENAASRGELVDKLDLLKRLEPIYAGMKEKVLSSQMSEAQKDALLQELTKLHQV